MTDSGREYTVEEVIEYNEDKDYIIFQVENISATNFVEIAETTPAIGENALAIGNPRGLDHTLSEGIISGYRQSNSFIQTTAEITHGSSGGVLLNMEGKAIGITTMGVGEANLNFAVNIKELRLERFL